MREALQAVEITDKIALGILSALARRLQHVDGRTPRSAVARAQLLHNHSALRIDLLGLQSDEVRPVVQDEQRRVDDSLALHGNIAHVVLRQVPRGERIKVGSELHTDLLQILDQGLVGEILGAVEGHVLQKVSQTLLRIILLNSSYVVYDIEVGHVLRLLVVTDVVGQPVGEHARANLLIGLDGLHAIDLRLRRHRHTPHEECHGDK